jgi:hypothetical protein
MVGDYEIIANFSYGGMPYELARAGGSPRSAVFLSLISGQFDG